MNNRSKGLRGERKYRLIFIDLGYTKCETSRNSSRLLDNCKVDLDFLPFNVQIKTGKHTSMKPDVILTEMKTLIESTYEDTDRINYPYFIIHELEGKKGKVRTHNETQVHIRYSDLQKIIKTLPNLEYDFILKMPFDNLKPYIKK